MSGSTPDDDRIRPAGRLEAVEWSRSAAPRRVAGGDDVEADVVELALEPAGTDHEHAPDVGQVLAQVERGRARRADDPIRADRRAHPGQPGHVVGPVVHRVVRDVHDVVAARRPIGQHGGDAGHRLGAAIDDAVEIDEEEHP